jgi:glycine cleavage system aminomethyltransferase T
VHRKFSGFVAEGRGAITAGSKIISDEKEVGEITSIAELRTPLGERTLALGYIRREVGVPGHEVTIGTVKATVVQLPLVSGALGQAEAALLHQL